MRKLAQVAIALVVACGHHDSAPPPSPPAPAPIKVVADKDAPDGLDLRVSNGKQGAPAYDHAKVAAAAKISDADAQALLARGKPLAVDQNDQQAFALRPASQPPPKTGDTISSSFPAPPSSLLPPKASDAGKDLEVLRYMPQGNVPVAPELSVTFSQPMVAVTSQEDAAKTTPVHLTPTPKGKWRWIGTRTILFDPDVRFPQATTYQIEIPAGTKSAGGGVLKKAVAFQFSTRTPTIISHTPDDGMPQRRDVPVFMEFDQKVDPNAVLQHLHVTVDKADQQIRLVEAAEIEKDKLLAARVDQAKKDEHDGRWLVVRTVKPLPTDAQVTVTLAAGTPSLEGPDKTSQPQSFDFHTYPPLRLMRAECNWGSECRPGSPFLFQFNNPIDGDAFDDKLVTLEPAIPDAKIYAQGGGYVIIEGLGKARTSYRVAISASLRDEFGQTLGNPVSKTFQVGDAYPTFFGPSGMVVLDPSALKPTLDFFTTNYEQLKVRLYKVEPGDLDAFAKYTREQWNHDHPPAMPGTKVMDQLMKTKTGWNELVETSIDLQTALKGGKGHVIAVVEPHPWREKYEPPRMIAWVQATKLAIDAHVDNDQLVAFATELDTGKPAGNVELEIRPFGIKGTTDDRGMATLPLGKTALKSIHYLVAKRGDDVAFVMDDNGYWSEYGSWNKRDAGNRLAWYVIDDRNMYKPGEEVSLKGWLRTIDDRKNGDVGALAGAVTSVSYKVSDETGNQIAAGTAQVDAVGGFDTKFTLPKTPNLGSARIDFTAKGTLAGTYEHVFQIEEFRTPEFEVSAQASQGPFVVGGGGDVTVEAKYYAGGALPGAAVRWYVTANQTNYTPPNRDDYSFGNWVPWWDYRGGWDEEGPRNYKPPRTWNLADKTDATGAHVLHMDFLSVKPAMPMSVTANASVEDVNRQAWSASAALIVHPSSYYVGLKAKRAFVDKGTPMDIDVIGVDLDGKAAPGAKIELQSVRLDWEYKHGRYTTKEVEPQACAVTAAKDPAPCHFKTDKGGTYQVTATIVDPQGRANQSKLEYWVTGGDQPAAREVAQERVQLIPDKKEYSPGNTAELLMQAPFYPAEGLVTWRRSGIVKMERFTLDGPTKVLTVPIEDAMVPNLVVQVDLVGAAARTDDHGVPDPKLPKRPAYAVGTIDLKIPAKQRTLAVSVAPAAPKVAPGEATKISVLVVDAAGKPAADAEVAVVVVDEAILSLTGYQFGSPIDTFYAERGSDTRDTYLRAYVHLAKPDITKMSDDEKQKAGRGMAADKPMETTAAAAPEAPPPASGEDRRANAPMKELARKRDDWGAVTKNEKVGGKSFDFNNLQQQPVAVRSNFNPLAAFAPAVKTGADGRATVDIKMPDNLTRYRVVAIAAAGDRNFGKGESALTARLPLMVRPSPPRFLNFGDTFQLPVVVQNQTDAPMKVRLAVRAANAKITDGAGREVTVPANDRVEVRFPAAADLAGTARFQIIAAAGPASDAAEVALPVWTPATTEAFATYGTIDSGAIKQPVALPGQVVTQFGGLEVTTASTNLGALTDALLYLVHYPFECAEQRSSRILAIATLRDVLTAFKTKDMPTAAQMEHSVDVDVEHLSQMQNEDGGFAFWDRGYPSVPYLSVFVIDALAHAKAKGFMVPQGMIDRAKPFLRDIENYYPSWYPADVRHAISAFALYTRKQIGDLDIAKGQRLIHQAGGVEKLTMEADGWLLGLFAGNAAAASERSAILRHAQNHVSETAGAANFTTSYADGNYLLLSSDRRVDGVMLESLIQEQKDLDLIPKVVTGLLAHRKAGRWEDTQENAFVLSALDLYFRTYEKTTPDFVARVWLGNDYAGDHTFKGRTTEDAHVAIAMKDVATHDKQDLTIQKDGAGRLYYRIGMTYAPASLKLDPADYGFVVERRYEGADDRNDVSRDSNGTWHVKAGARVRVKLTMVNENRRYHVALVDPMPAGFEAMNPALAVTGPIPLDPSEQKARGDYWWWYGPWYEHQNLRDERVEAFASLLWEGVHEYEYVARATTPGSFVVPPTTAQEMYMPETFGRAGSDRVIVE